MSIPDRSRELQIVNAFPEALKAAKAEQLHSDPPEYLYHYTDVKGLIGILENDCLFATNSLFLNDASESSYALHILDKAIEDCLAKTESEAAHRLLEEFKGHWVTTDYAFYVACFCEDGNLLNQWRVYAPSDGYTLRFNTAELLRGQDEARPRHYFSLKRVVYKEEEQLALLGDLFDIVVKYAETHYPKRGDVQWSEGTLQGYVYRPLLQLLLTFKHPAFEVEQEWRLVCGESGPWSGAKYRAGKYGLTPYVEFYRAELEREPDANKGIKKEKNEKRLKLPISHVMHGPIAGLGPANFVVDPEKPVRTAAGQALHGILQRCGYTNVEVGGSLLPIR